MRIRFYILSGNVQGSLSGLPGQEGVHLVKIARKEVNTNRFWVFLKFIIYLLYSLLKLHYPCIHVPLTLKCRSLEFVWQFCKEAVFIHTSFFFNLSEKIFTR